MLQEKIIKPWGYYIDHYRSEACVQKTIYIAPNKRLSLQYHSLRGEFWYVESGMGLIRIDSVRRFIDPGFKIEIPAGTVHRIENTCDDWLVVHEMQYGVCREEDIIRLEDDYNRNS